MSTVILTALISSLGEALSVRSLQKLAIDIWQCFKSPPPIFTNSVRSSEGLLGYGAEILGVKRASSGHFFLNDLSHQILIVWNYANKIYKYVGRVNMVPMRAKKRRSVIVKHQL